LLKTGHKHGKMTSSEVIVTSSLWPKYSYDEYQKTHLCVKFALAMMSLKNDIIFGQK